MFINPYFKFDNIYSKDINIGIATFDNSLFSEIGMNYKNSISKENNTTTPIWTEGDDSPDTISLNLVLYDKESMRPIKWTNELISYVYNWLITDDFKQFISDDNIDLVYYMKAVAIKKQISIGSLEGYLEVEFQPFSKYVYMRIEEVIITNTSSAITLNNPSKYSYRPVLEITNLGDITTINKINNLELSNLNTNEKVIVDNLMLTVLDTNGNNKMSNCNRKWFELISGDNEITVEGNCEVKILCEIPLYR